MCRPAVLCCFVVVVLLQKFLNNSLKKGVLDQNFFSGRENARRNSRVIHILINPNSPKTDLHLLIRDSICGIPVHCDNKTGLYVKKDISVITVTFLIVRSTNTCAVGGVRVSCRGVQHGPPV